MANRLSRSSVPVNQAAAQQQTEYCYPYGGEPRWYSSMYVKLNDGVVVTTLDITERKQAVVLRDDQDQPQRLLGVDLDLSEVRRFEADNLRLRLEQQRALFGAMQQAQEAERRRMAEALYNGVDQLLYATKLWLDQLHTEPAREATRLLARAIRQTRALSHELVPLVLEDFGFRAALQDIRKNLSSSRLQFECVLHLDEEVGPLPSALQMALYRMAQHPRPGDSARAAPWS